MFPAYGLDGLPLDDLAAAAELLGDIDARRVAYDATETSTAAGRDRVEISTVFLVFDHAHTRSPHIPVLWETMVSGGTLDGEIRRYTSRDDALAGHRDLKLLSERAAEH